MKALIFILSILTISMVATANDTRLTTHVVCKTSTARSEHDLVFTISGPEVRIGFESNESAFILQHNFPKGTSIYNFKGYGNGFESTQILIMGPRVEIATRSEKSNKLMVCFGPNIPKAIRMASDLYEQVNSPEEEPEPAPAPAEQPMAPQPQPADPIASGNK
jgi:hypothetical protein